MYFLEKKRPKSTLFIVHTVQILANINIYKVMKKNRTRKFYDKCVYIVNLESNKINQ